MKALNSIFFSCVAGIALCLVMSIVTAVQLHHKAQVPISIPLPAVSQ